MRISRDVVRPLVALVVILAAMALVTNVAAYRVATTSHGGQAASGACPKADAAAHRDGDADRDGAGSASACRRSSGSATDENRRAVRSRESRESGESGESRASGGRVVTVSGAS
ncbi:MAG: hypothetical protein ABEJ81_05095 [Haloferacaceae archaeon]